MDPKLNPFVICNLIALNPLITNSKQEQFETGCYRRFIYNKFRKIKRDRNTYLIVYLTSDRFPPHRLPIYQLSPLPSEPLSLHRLTPITDRVTIVHRFIKASSTGGSSPYAKHICTIFEALWTTLWSVWHHSH